MTEIEQPRFDFARRAPDITRRRNGGNSQSIAANQRCATWKTADRNRLRDMIRAAGVCGLTSLEIEIELKRPKNFFSGRLSELKQSKEIFAVGERDGCAVLVHRDWMLGGAA